MNRMLFLSLDAPWLPKAGVRVASMGWAVSPVRTRGESGSPDRFVAGRFLSLGHPKRGDGGHWGKSENNFKNKKILKIKARKKRK